jgi:hypothetical protein
LFPFSIGQQLPWVLTSPTSHTLGFRQTEVLQRAAAKEEECSPLKGCVHKEPSSLWSQNGPANVSCVCQVGTRHFKSTVQYENRTMKPVEIVLRRGKGDEEE